MPLQVDFLTRIVNVQWGGGAVFIYGTSLGNKLYYVKFKSKGDANPVKRTIELPEPDTAEFESVASRFAVTGSSYAKVGGNTDGKGGKPTFLICGGRGVPHMIDDGIGNLVPVSDSHTLIYASNDGINWNDVLHKEAIIVVLAKPSSLSPNALVWNPDNNKFYYDQTFRESEIEIGGDVSISDQIFSSSDGTVWNMVQSNETGASPDYHSPFPSLCVSNDCLDERGQNVPDGVMRTDKSSKTTAQPVLPPVVTYESGGIGYLSEENRIKVITETNTEDGGDEQLVAIPGISSVTCVAGVNGIFMAGGFAADESDAQGAVAVSMDGGQTWKSFATTPNGVTTMIAGVVGKQNES